jgi:Glycosyltransferase like family 2
MKWMVAIVAHSSKETLSIGWCDNGNVDGKFAEGLLYSTLTGPSKGVQVNNAIRVQGNQIGRQRQALLDMWYDSIKTDWLLWVDSDIVLTSDILALLWQTADKIVKPVVCGTYFISKQMEKTLMQPMPALFEDTGNVHQIKHLHPLPFNQVVKIDIAGLGLCLMHRSVVTALREKHGNQSMFAEVEGIGDEYIGEDVVFFRKVKEAGVPVHAHTGAIAKHMKRFAFDENYYGLYWESAGRAAKEEAERANTASEQQA